MCIEASREEPPGAGVTEAQHCSAAFCCTQEALLLMRALMWEHALGAALLDGMLGIAGTACKFMAAARCLALWDQAEVSPQPLSLQPVSCCCLHANWATMTAPECGPPAALVPA